jgi:hypothetical protein
MSLSNEPAGSSGAHHCANSSVTGPLELLELPPPEPQPTAVTPTSAAAVTTPSSRFSRPCNLAPPAVIANSFI